jgi:eukaryotic-like serine/threonine-protein kinase
MMKNISLSIGVLISVSMLLDACATATPTAAPATVAPATAAPATAAPATTAPTPGIGSTWTRPADGMLMLYVPAGSFTMGTTIDQATTECQDCKPSLVSDEQPPHSVNLDAFWMDKTDVTNAMYALCVKAGVCQAPVLTSSATRSSYYGNTQYADYPVIYMSWTDANAYCGWAGARLPTEAEWEKAALGTDGRIYPWGNGRPDKSLLNYNSQIGDTSAVGSYPSGASPYGLLDMAGNVWQWVNDWYDANYYASSPVSNPQGPASGDGRVLRGGAWNVNGYLVLPAYRSVFGPTNALNYFGFRCSRSLP